MEIIFYQNTIFIKDLRLFNQFNLYKKSSEKN